MSNPKTEPLDYSANTGSHGGVVTQTIALFVDAYRELNARKLFWVTLALSLVVVGIFSLVGINDRGIVLAKWQMRTAFNTNIIPAKTFYTYLFTTIAIPYWLGVGATLLALMSVGSVFPDMLTSGAIDMYLSKPIGRMRLFFTKYVTGLLFVALQVLVFSFASFLVIGIRSGSWEFGIFLAVPLVTLLFSYLYSACVLLGLLTRSTLASLLITIVFWLVLFLLNVADARLQQFVSAADERVKEQQARIDFNQNILDRAAKMAPEKRGNVDGFVFQRDAQTTMMPEYQETARNLHWWHNLIVGVKFPLPKTGETTLLLDTWLVDPVPLFKVREQSEEDRKKWIAEHRKEPPKSPDGNERQRLDPDDDAVVAQAANDAIRARGVKWSIGTSLGFEAAVLGLGALIFSRRDF